MTGRCPRAVGTDGGVGGCGVTLCVCPPAQDPHCGGGNRGRAGCRAAARRGSCVPAPGPGPGPPLQGTAVPFGHRSPLNPSGGDELKDTGRHPKPPALTAPPPPVQGHPEHCLPCVHRACRGSAETGQGGGPGRWRLPPMPHALTRNFRFCFQWLPWALVLRWASVTTWISSHSSALGLGRCCSDLIISSFRRRSRFSSISFRFATRFESSSTTAGSPPPSAGTPQTPASLCCAS